MPQPLEKAVRFFPTVAALLLAGESEKAPSPFLSEYIVRLLGRVAREGLKTARIIK
jgi:hypothetical protein